MSPLAASPNASRTACLLPPVLWGVAVSVLIGWLEPAILRAADLTSPPANPSESDGLDFFETHIRPVLNDHRYDCHSADAKTVRGGLLLDSRAGLLRGGDSGPAVVPGDVENSLIVSALRHESFEMPPREKLSEEVAGRFAHWIRSGAPDPRSETESILPSRIDPIAARDHWAFQPVTRPSIPAAQDDQWSAWIQSPIDAFVARELAAKNWRPAAEADAYTWIRRATFDLIGLPPTTEEIEAFVDDESPDRFARVVDRLLASPHYGERWGRHWLDLVRYADTNGADENHTMPNAWRYRDWVVRSINRDQPLNDFVVHQLAGDLLAEGADEPTRRELLTATGMLVIGPKMLAEQDKEKMRIDIIDEQIDTVSRTLMGMTIACARCHDHKFDPILADDYYALAGIFASTRTMLHENHVSKWMERELPSAKIDALRKEHQSKIDAAANDLQLRIAQANVAVWAELKLEKLLDKPSEHYPEAAKAAIAAAEEKLKALEKAMPAYETVMAVQEAEPIDLPVHIRGNHLRKADQVTERGVPRRIAEVSPFTPIDATTSGRLQLARWLTGGDHVLTGRVISNRLWMWHFGKSLVASPSNFGLQCPQPLHADLLDWMTRQLIDQGWSLKQMHRVIMLSSTYRMSSRDSTYAAEDPENQFMWRQNRRRLEVEPLRDAILAVGDSLDRQVGGPPEGVASARRTVYLSINRAALLDLLSTFDYVEPANHIEQRSVTIVPSQALFLLNNPLIHQQADRLAKRLLETESDDLARQTRLWMELYGRPPTQQQRKLMTAFLDQLNGHSHPPAIWATLCRTLIAGSLFSYVQ
jgi:hypothetical protein